MAKKYAVRLIGKWNKPHWPGEIIRLPLIHAKEMIRRGWAEQVK